MPSILESIILAASIFMDAGEKNNMQKNKNSICQDVSPRYTMCNIVYMQHSVQHTISSNVYNISLPLTLILAFILYFIPLIILNLLFLK